LRGVFSDLAYTMGGTVKGAAVGLTTALTEMAKSFGPEAGIWAEGLSVALLATIDAADAAFSKVKALVGLFSPGTVQLFQQAVDNLGAAFGSALTPIIEMATDIIREMNV
jgi:hypothetical protein